MAFFDVPRGKRNNNPFNIDYSPKNPWDGQIGIEPKSPNGTQRFSAFIDPVFGARAFFKLLETYKSKHKIDTVQKMVQRFAPDTENDTSAYAEFVAKSLGVNVSDKIDLTDKDTAISIAKAKAQFENGIDTKDVISEVDLIRAQQLATGSKYTPEEKTLSDSRKKGEFSENVVKTLLMGSFARKGEEAPVSAPITEGNVEAGVIASIRRQLIEQGGLEQDKAPTTTATENVAQEAPVSPSEALTAEEETRLQELEAKYEGVDDSKGDNLSPEEEARLQELEIKFGEVHKGPAFEEEEPTRDLIQEIYG